MDSLKKHWLAIESFQNLCLTYLHCHYGFAFCLNFCHLNFYFHLLYHRLIHLWIQFYNLHAKSCLFFLRKLFLNDLISSCSSNLYFSSSSYFYFESYFYFYLILCFVTMAFFFCLAVWSIFWIYLISFKVFNSWPLKSLHIEDLEQNECILLIIDILMMADQYFTILNDFYLLV